MWKIKRGHSRGVIQWQAVWNGGQCGRTYSSHIFRESPPRISDHMPGHMTVHVGRSTVFTNWAGYATTTRRVQHIQRAPDLEMYRVSRLLRRGRVGSKVRTKNMINTALEIERLWRWTYLPHALFFNIIDYSPTLGSWHAISNAFPFMLLLCTDTWHVKALQSWIFSSPSHIFFSKQVRQLFHYSLVLWLSLLE